MNEHKHLGIILDSKLFFVSHIKTLNELYKLYVRPHLDYGDVIYTIPPNKCDLGQNMSLTNHMEKLDSVQYSAGLALNGAWRGTSHKKLYEELCWESLSLRRWNRDLILFYKFVYNISLEYTRYPIQNFNKLCIPYEDLI